MVKHSALKQARPKKHDQAASGLRELKNAKTRSLAPELDRLIHERLRLGIVSALAANESLTFNDLKSFMNTTDTKFFEGRVPKTEYKLTASGRRALESYLNHMETLIQQMRNR